jgi:UDP-N-acetylmuramate--alanine ligase
MNKVPFYGAAILCLDDSRLAGLIPKVRKRVITYGMASQADYQARDIAFEGVESSFTLYVRGEKTGRVTIPVPGKHNVLNCLGALAASHELGMDIETAIKSCRNFGGVKRRFETKGRTANGALVMDDYAHHPTEIRATLEAARNSWPDRRLVICFQPHRYSRTRLLFDDFATSFYGADLLLVMDIYAASEKKDPTVSAESLAEAIRDHGHRNVEYVGKKAQAKERLQKLLEPDDVLFTMGAGDVYRMGEELATGQGDGIEA